MAEAAGLYSHSLGDGDEKDVVIAKVKWSLYGRTSQIRTPFGQEIVS